MKLIPINLNGLKKEDAFSIATALLYTLKDSPQYSTVSELFYILDHDNFIKLIKYFGGKTIRIPSSVELNEMLQVLLLYQYREVENLDWDVCLQKVGASNTESKSLRGKVNSLRQILTSLEVGRSAYE